MGTDTKDWIPGELTEESCSSLLQECEEAMRDIADDLLRRVLEEVIGGNDVQIVVRKPNGEKTEIPIFPERTQATTALHQQV